VWNIEEAAFTDLDSSRAREAQLRQGVQSTIFLSDGQNRATPGFVLAEILQTPASMAAHRSYEELGSPPVDAPPVASLAAAYGLDAKAGTKHIVITGRSLSLSLLATQLAVLTPRMVPNLFLSRDPPQDIISHPEAAPGSSSSFSFAHVFHHHASPTHSPLTHLNGLSQLRSSLTSHFLLTDQATPRLTRSLRFLLLAPLIVLACFYLLSPPAVCSVTPRLIFAAATILGPTVSPDYSISSVRSPSRSCPTLPANSDSPAHATAHPTTSNENKHSTTSLPVQLNNFTVSPCRLLLCSHHDLPTTLCASVALVDIPPQPPPLFSFCYNSQLIRRGLTHSFKTVSPSSPSLSTIVDDLFTPMCTFSPTIQLDALAVSCLNFPVISQSLLYLIVIHHPSLMDGTFVTDEPRNFAYGSTRQTIAVSHLIYLTVMLPSTDQRNQRRICIPFAVLDSILRAVLIFPTSLLPSDFICILLCSPPTLLHRDVDLSSNSAMPPRRSTRSSTRRALAFPTNRRAPPVIDATINALTFPNTSRRAPHFIDEATIALALPTTRRAPPVIDVTSVMQPNLYPRRAPQTIEAATFPCSAPRPALSTSSAPPFPVTLRLSALVLDFDPLSQQPPEQEKEEDATLDLVAAPRDANSLVASQPVDSTFIPTADFTSYNNSQLARNYFFNHDLMQAPYQSLSTYFTFRATDIQYFSYNQHPTLTCLLPSPTINPTAMGRSPRALSPIPSSLRSTTYPLATLAIIEDPPQSPLTGLLTSTCSLDISRLRHLSFIYHSWPSRLYSHPTFARLIIIASLGDFIDLPQFVSALVLNFMLDCSHCSLFSLMAPMFNPLGLLFSSPCIMESFFCLHPDLHASVTARPTTQTSAHRNFRRPARLMTSQFILTCYTHQHESTLCIGLPFDTDAFPTLGTPASTSTLHRPALCYVAANFTSYCPRVRASVILHSLLLQSQRIYIFPRRYLTVHYLTTHFLPQHSLSVPPSAPTSTPNSSSPYFTIASTPTCSLQPPPCIATYSKYNELSHISNYDFTSRPHASTCRQLSNLPAFNCFFSISANLLFSSSSTVTSYQLSSLDLSLLSVSDAYFVIFPPDMNLNKLFKTTEARAMSSPPAASSAKAVHSIAVSTQIVSTPTVLTSESATRILTSSLPATLSIDWSYSVTVFTYPLDSAIPTLSTQLSSSTTSSVVKPVYSSLIPTVTQIFNLTRSLDALLTTASKLDSFLRLSSFLKVISLSLSLPIAPPFDRINHSNSASRTSNSAWADFSLWIVRLFGDSTSPPIVVFCTTPATSTTSFPVRFLHHERCHPLFSSSGNSNYSTVTTVLHLPNVFIYSQCAITIILRSISISACSNSPTVLRYLLHYNCPTSDVIYLTTFHTSEFFRQLTLLFPSSPSIIFWLHNWVSHFITNSSSTSLPYSIFHPYMRNLLSALLIFKCIRLFLLVLTFTNLRSHLNGAHDILVATLSLTFHVLITTTTVALTPTLLFQQFGIYRLLLCSKSPRITNNAHRSRYKISLNFVSFLTSYLPTRQLFPKPYSQWSIIVASGLTRLLL